MPLLQADEGLLPQDETQAAAWNCIPILCMYGHMHSQQMQFACLQKVMQFKQGICTSKARYRIAAPLQA